MKSNRILLFAAAVLLFYPNHSAAQQERKEPPAAIGESSAPKDPIPMERFRIAAEQGQVGAQFHMGSVYAEGRGVKQDYIQAYKWLALSVAGSTDESSSIFKKATDLLNSVSKSMTSRQIEEAERLAMEWEARYVQRVGEGPFSSGWGVTFPVVSIKPSPSYTNEARDARISGSISIQCIIFKDGTVGNCRIIKGLGYGLDESAINTVESEWRFQPGTFQDKPVDVQVSLSITYRISQKP